MPSRVSVFNGALDHLGEPNISGPNDTSSWARKLAQSYPRVVESLQSIYPWNFSGARAELALLDETPIGRDYAYAKPADFLSIRMINTSGDPNDQARFDYDDESGKILTNLSPCYLFYGRILLDQEGMWPAVFADAVSAELAFRTAPGITARDKRRDQCEKDAARLLRKAKTWDASQKPYRKTPHGSIVMSVRGGTRYRENG